MRIGNSICFSVLIGFFPQLLTGYSPKSWLLDNYLIEETFDLMSIYVGNLAYSITQENLTEVFAEYGKVKRVHVPTDRETGRMRGFAFVEMETPEEEASAIEELNGAEWMGRELKVNEARPREPRSSFSGGGGGGGRRNDRF